MKLWMSIWCQVLFVRLEASRYLTSGYLKPQCISNLGIKYIITASLFYPWKLNELCNFEEIVYFMLFVCFFSKSFNLDEHWPPGNSGNKINGLHFFPPTIICDSGRILPCEVAIHNPRRRMHIVLTCEWRYPLIGPDQEKIQSPMRPAYRAEKFQLSKRNR